VVVVVAAVDVDVAVADVVAALSSEEEAAPLVV
jgi:hypothetical protein